MSHFIFHQPTASSKLKPDMVLEDVESDNEGQQQDQLTPPPAPPSTTLTPPSPTLQPQPEATQQSRSISVMSQNCADTNLEPPQSESATKISQEDAETQTGRWTPFIESIKKEAEDVALATMEER